MSEQSNQVQTYQELVLAYEQLGEQIQALIGGQTKDMSPTAMHEYRQIAAQRDDLYNQIKAIEAVWGD